MSALITLLLAAAPQVAVLSTAADQTELRFQPLGVTELADVVVRFHHLDGASVEGALLPDARTVVAVTALDSRLDDSFGSVLLRLEPGSEPSVVVNRVAEASRPVVSASGRVFVQRGRAGPSREPLMRVDALSVDEVNLQTKIATPMYETHGYFLYPAGVAGDELVLYEATPTGARLLAVRLDSRATRELATLAPLAHDFVVDGGARRVVYTVGSPRTHDYTVVQTQLDGSGSRVLARGTSMALLPTVMGDGRVAYCPGAGLGLIDVETKSPLVAAQGAGFERVRVVTAKWLVALHETPSAFAKPYVLQLPSAALRSLAGPVAVPLPVPAGTRTTIVGVTP